MIQIDIKAAVMLFVTLLLGVALGALGVGALSRERNAEVQQLRRPPGFVAHMEGVIQPRDSAQRAQVEPILAAAASRNDSILHSTNEQLRAALDSMRLRLAPMLDAPQRARLEQAARLAPQMQAPGGGGDRGDRPPPREGAPPPGRGPPPDGPPPGGPRGRRGPPPDGRGPPPDGRGPPPDGRGPP